MLSFPAFGTRVGVSLWFALFFAALFISNDSTVGAYAAAMVLHEAGHLIFMLLQRERAAGISFYLGRIEIERGRGVFSHRHDMLVFGGGAAANLAAALVVSLFFKSYSYFAAINLLTAAYNLLPAASFDGERILRCFLAIKGLEPVRFEWALKTVSLICAFLMLTFSLLGLFNSSGSAVLLFLSFYVFVTTLTNM